MKIYVYVNAGLTCIFLLFPGPIILKYIEEKCLKTQIKSENKV